ncbi:DUF4174 domain-containing protein [Glaciecola petra]|uniref:DUF4174 domain-containing protein n=1 Tax=Glaciecola petra TaxID=3075602 RepID=A0ABU2ZR71_9ALTE|nr:DUF4174 domain-containing protein [Aestuariibacter sp. P117]MDT0594891.1 DUF4174 domain-containing protein [Aestuariibacter sp. P117]
MRTNRFIGLYILLFTAFNAYTFNMNTTAKIPSKSLNDYLYEYRVVVIQGSEQLALEWVNQRYIANKAGIIERKIKLLYLTNGKVLDIGEDKQDSGLTLADVKPRMQDKALILIGLDGGTKSFYERFDLQMIFADIDGMPMRRAQLRRASSN